MRLLITSIIVIFSMNSCQEKGNIANEKITEIKQETQTGEFIEKYPSGAVKIKGDLVKGIRQGTWVSYYENGTQWSESTYLFGLREGTYKLFYPNGRLKIHGSYKNEKKAGIWYFYNENGQFEKEMDFDETEPNESN